VGQHSARFGYSGKLEVRGRNDDGNAAWGLSSEFQSDVLLDLNSPIPFETVAYLYRHCLAGITSRLQHSLAWLNRRSAVMSAVFTLARDQVKDRGDYLGQRAGTDTTLVIFRAISTGIPKRSVLACLYKARKML
jgi:hypothetical protein